jgi:hypothetical protein
MWFVAVAVVIAGGLSFGGSVSTGSGVLLLAACLVPPTIILMIWPGLQRPTVAEVLYQTERRG